jgi:hypothetical protein
MSCLSVEITNLSHSLQLEASRLSGISVDVTRHDLPLLLDVSDAFSSKHLKVTCGIVCDVGDFHYLRVSPHEVQWITPDEAIVYMVESDTSWTIITS